MKAIYYTEYGSPDVLQLRDVPTPTPKDDEVLIRVHAAALNAYDWHIMRADPFLARLARGLFRPKNNIPGADVAGVVEAVGKNVTGFQPGDAVYADMAGAADGAFAEYVCAPLRLVAPKPTNLSFEEAAGVPMAAVTALQALRDTCQVKPGQQVLINGASGGVGTFAVQIAKLLGVEVTAVCSTNKVTLTRKLGADHVIDYKHEDFTKLDKRYDVILGIGGYVPLKQYVNTLKPGGIYAMVGGTNRQIFEALLLGAFMARDGKKIAQTTAKPNAADLVYLNEHIEAGKIKPVIDRCYPLAETADAMRYLEEGHAKGKIVIKVVDR
ncbi:MAG: NAD(P)-dependent alcohol dehydrogenase [Caldilineaceae bacterium]|nr:NAD(P)-dependent alcohol dehydrogenase [Caldilineaceae bacterium]